MPEWANRTGEAVQGLVSAYEAEAELPGKVGAFEGDQERHRRELHEVVEGERDAELPNERGADGARVPLKVGGVATQVLGDVRSGKPAARDR